ncbi:hypothetical protein APS_2782 [Acetobacter pasteurianus subsp. pasteurianus LMG 1262 = NBRC 106471]|nr:hypothetical protein APS_2782 [Acetobacter pasteurianus subsp. pasteurianus LMG 1262 = NBRC 106471]
MLCPSACSRGRNRLEGPEAQKETKKTRLPFWSFSKPVEHEMRVSPLPGTGQHILPIQFLSYSALLGPISNFSDFGPSRAK